MADDECSLEGSLQELIQTSSLKWIFVGGKGGVGKTTTSCAIAAKLAEQRESVLLLSTDPAHNLSDALTQKFSSTPSLVNGFTNLYAMEIDAKQHEAADFRLAESAEAKAIGQVLPEILQAVPGIDEALSFAELMQSVQTMTFSAIVFDTAPTGHTLRLLGFPDLLERSLAKLSGFKGHLNTALGLIGAVSGNNVQTDEFSAKIDNIRAVTTSVREAFQDPARTTFVCVCTPEFLSLFETERLVQELLKHKIDCSNIVVNQVLMPIGARDDDMPPLPSSLPQAVGAPEAPLKSPYELLQPVAPRGPQESAEEETKRLSEHVLQLQKRLLLVEQSYAARRRMQSKYLVQIQELYSFDFHVVCVGQQSEEIRGVDKLKKLGDLLCQETTIPILK